MIRFLWLILALTIGYALGQQPLPPCTCYQVVDRAVMYRPERGRWIETDEVGQRPIDFIVMAEIESGE